MYLPSGSSRYSDDAESARVSPKKPWGDFTLDQTSASSNERSTPWWAKILLWAPNRIIDFYDIFRADVGAGMSYGGVLRLSRHVQMGYRDIDPVSVRVGAFGRRAPVLIEHSNEFGIGPAFVESDDRRICDGEVGLGLDVFLVGAYGGICVEEVVDFVAGIFFLDVMGDDIR